MSSAGATSQGSMDTPDLSVVIVTWNVGQPVLACLEALANRAGKLTLEIVLVDNASSDGTVAAVAGAFPWVRIIENSRNVGFPRANNGALFEARGRHVLFLNPDTVVGEGTLEACVGELDTDPSIGLVGCRLIHVDGTVQKECARRHYRLRHLLWEAFYLQVRFPGHPIFADQLLGSWDHRGRRYVEAVTGAFMMVRRPLAVRLGGLPDELFMYHEDLAFCLRVSRGGLRIKYVGDFETVHAHGASSGSSPLELSLLEGPVRVALIRERWGRIWGWAAQGLFALRSLTRSVIAMVGSLLPGLSGAKARYPKVFQPRRHLLNLLWSLAPWAVRARMPAPPLDDRPSLLVIGPIPPPVHGVSAYTRMLLETPALHLRCRVDHLDTSDRRSLENIGRFDLQNVGLALEHLAKLVGLLRRRRPTAVYVQVSQNALAYLRDGLFILLSKAVGARVVTHLHGGSFRRFYEETSGPMQRMIRSSTRLVDAAWVHGEGLRAIYEGLLPPERVQVIPNGVPDFAHVIEAPQRAGREWSNGRDPVILYIGQLIGVRGTFDLLEAARGLAERRIRARFVLAGGWVNSADHAAAEKFLVEGGLLDSVVFPGVVDGARKLQLFAEADIFAFPTRHPLEGQPLAILEAMAASLPVVTTRRGAIPDCVIDGETGVFVDEGDERSLLEALSTLIQDPYQRAQMGRAGRQRYLDRFTWERSVDRFVSHMSQVLEYRPGEPDTQLVESAESKVL